MARLLVARTSVIASCSSRCSSFETGFSHDYLRAPIRARLKHHDLRLSFRSAAFRDRIDARRPGGRRRRYSPDATSDEEGYLTDLQVPRAWVSPEIATQEADWLKGALHRWLDEEYCPEPANEEISRRCSKVYYYCLLEEQLDIGDILMQMVRDLETFSFKESFHGAFSSANAAIELIRKRMGGTEAASSN